MSVHSKIVDAQHAGHTEIMGIGGLVRPGPYEAGHRWLRCSRVRQRRLI